MNKKMIYGVLAFGMLGCEYYDFKLEVVNNSDASISVQSVQDTVLRIEAFNHYSHYIQSEIPAGTSQKLKQTGKNGWIGTVENSVNKKLNLIVFRKDSLLKYKSIGYLLENEIFTRYSFSKEQLDSIDWSVVIKR